jgi:quercetin dioxygenase-like cupin family protein
MRLFQRFFIRAVIALVGLSLSGIQIGAAEQQAMKRTELLKTNLADLGDKEMHVWIADIGPGAATGRHTHPTPRFVYVLEGSVVLEMESKPPHAFKAGEAFVEMPNETHNFKNASTTEPAKALGFQYAGAGQSLQAAAP